MATQQYSVLPPISATTPQNRAHYAAPNVSSAPTLPSIGSLISGADSMAPAGPDAAYQTHYHAPHHLPQSPQPTYRSSMPQNYAPPPSETKPPVGYSGHDQSISPAIASSQSDRRISAASKDRYPGTQGEHACHLTPPTSRIGSWTHPNSAWPGQIPHNYTFTAQAVAPQPARIGYPAHPAMAEQAQQSQRLAASPRFVAQQAAPSAYTKAEDVEVEIKPRILYEQSRRLVEEFDLLDTLNHIKEANKQIGDFAVHYSERALATQRTGPLPGATPNLMEIDRMIHHHNDVQHNLLRLRDVIAEQQAILAEHSREQMHKHALASAPDNSFVHDAQDAAHNAQPDNKKRRGRAAPPGRCHSCLRSETPEWRRGPDGARTLCNACGLHYAKLTRKLGAKAAAALPLSALRRSIDTGGLSAL